MQPQASPTPQSPLTIARILWAAMLLGELAFLVVILVLQRSQDLPTSPETGQLLFYISAAQLLTIVPVGFVIRNSIFQKARTRGLIAPAQYLTGNVVLWALCEATAFVGLLSVMLSANLLPNLFVPALAMLTQLLTFPTGEQLQK